MEKENEKENENVDIENIKFLHNLSREKFNFLMNNVDKLDQKFTTLFSADAVILTIIFSLNRFQQSAFFIAGVTLIIVAIITAVLGYIPKTFTDIDIKKYWEENYSSKYKETIAETTSNIVASYTKNRKVQDKKSKYVGLAFIFSMVGLLIIVLSQIICRGG